MIYQVLIISQEWIVVCPCLKSEKIKKSFNSSSFWNRVLEGGITPLNKVFASNLTFSINSIFFNSSKISKTLGWICKG